MTGIPYVKGSDTSKAAADSMEKPAINLRERIFVAIDATETDGMTCDEAEVALDLRHQTVSARIRELSLDGRLVETKNRRRTRAGRYAAVYVSFRHLRPAIGHFPEGKLQGELL